MKKAIFFFSFLIALTACNNSGDNNGANSDSSTSGGPHGTDTDTSSTQVQSIQNANGNMPDTANSINIGTETPNGKDSSKQH